MKDQSIQAVLEDDLIGLLKSIGELENIENGSRVCGECGRPIALQNLQMIVPAEKGTFRYVCNCLSCIDAYHRKTGEQ
jgi:RNA polymerase-binding transcription factor DksA